MLSKRLVVSCLRQAFVCCVLTTTVCAVHAQQIVNTDGINPADSHSELRVTIKNETELRLQKVRPDGTPAPPLHKVSQTVYRVKQGYDLQGSPVISLHILRDNNVGGKRRAEKITMKNGRIRRYDEHGNEIFDHAAPGVQDPSQREILSLLQVAAPVSISDPTKLAMKFHVQPVQIDPQTMSIETSSVKGKRSKLLFTQDLSGRWSLSRRESFRDDPFSSNHTTVSTEVISTAVNNENEAVRRSSSLASTSSVDSFRASKVQGQIASAKMLGNQQIASSISTDAIPTTDPASGPDLTPASNSYSSGANGANVVFLHGFLSNGGTWNKMQPWLSSDFNFPLALTPSVGSNGTEILNNWGSEVVNAIAPSGFTYSSPYIGIGHSAGGLVARSVAQGSPGVIGSVITIDTPHQGSDLLTNLQVDAVNQYINTLIQNSCYLDYGLCLTWSGIGSALLAGGATIGAISYAPAVVDLTVPNPYTPILNARPESFPRYGLVGMSDQNWISFRTLADFTGAPDPSSGQEAAEIAGDIDDGLIGLEYGFDATAWSWYLTWEWDGEDPDDPALDYAEYFWELEDDTYQVQYGLESFDSFWQQAATCDPYGISCDSSSDGVVQESSQIYPNAPNLFMTNFDGSHTTATKSQVTRSYLDQILSQQAFAPVQVCTINAQSVDYPGSTTLNLPFQGQVLTFSVQTSPGCNWSAATTGSWLSFIGSSTGSGSGTVQVLADYNNNSSLSPSGSITIGGSTFSVGESPLPAGVLQGGVTILPVIHPVPYWVCSPGPIAYDQAAFGGSSVTPNTCGGGGGPVRYPPPVGEVLQVVINGVTYTVSNPTNNTLSDAMSAASLINADPSSPVVAGVVASTTTLMFGSKQPQVSVPYSASVTVASGSPDIWVLPLGQVLQ